MTSIYILKYYYSNETYLFEFCLYIYFVMILIIKYTKFSKQILELKESYPYKSNLIQKYYIKSISDFLITLIINLSQYLFEKNANLSSQQNTISYKTILPALFE